MKGSKVDYAFESRQKFKWIDIFSDNRIKITYLVIIFRIVTLLYLLQLRCRWSIWLRLNKILNVTYVCLKLPLWSYHHSFNITYVTFVINIHGNTQPQNRHFAKVENILSIYKKDAPSLSTNEKLFLEKNITIMKTA